MNQRRKYPFLKEISYLMMPFIGFGCSTQPLTPKAPIKTNYSKRQTDYHPQKDGEPRHPKFMKHAKVEPKSEPISRYGNPDSYQVDGKTYEVMPTAKGYKQRGIASWYGTKFDKQRTSSGEAYDMYAMTGAHRTLPIPSYVRVRNLENNRTAIIRINDRGPFHSARILDLSYGAAHRLGLLPKGTARVEVETLLPKGQSSHHIAHYYLQAGAFSSKNTAEQLRKKLSHLTKASVSVEHLKDHFVVQLGPFHNKQATEQVKKQLVKQGMHGVFAFLQ